MIMLKYSCSKILTHLICMKELRGTLVDFSRHRFEARSWDRHPPIPQTRCGSFRWSQPYSIRDLTASRKPLFTSPASTQGPADGVHPITRPALDVSTFKHSHSPHTHLLSQTSMHVLVADDICHRQFWRWVSYIRPTAPRGHLNHFCTRSKVVPWREATVGDYCTVPRTTLTRIARYSFPISRTSFTNTTDL